MVDYQMLQDIFDKLNRDCVQEIKDAAEYINGIRYDRYDHSTEEDFENASMEMIRMGGYVKALENLRIITEPEACVLLKFIYEYYGQPDPS